MKNLIFSAIVLCNITIYAQYSGQVMSYGSGPGNANSLGQLEAVLGPISERDAKTNLAPEEIQGSPYTYNMFNKGNILYKDENSGSIYYRYNAYNEEIEIKENNLPNSPIRSLSKDKNITLIASDGTSLRFSTFTDKKDNTKNGYLNVLKEGDYTLYKRINVTFKEGQKAPNSFVKAKHARFSQFTEYYLEIEGANRVDEVELKNKKLLNLLPENIRPEIQKYLKDNSITISDENDLIKVVDYLNKSESL